jgi:hypothetical protein
MKGKERSEERSAGRTGRILALHGVAPQVDRRRFEFRNFEEVRALERFLSAAPPFLPLVEALAGRGDALTIDDATRGAADAALLARRYGHAVTLFVNPAQVESGAPYWFFLLNVLLDKLDGRRRDFEGTSFATSSVPQRNALRTRIKARVRAIKQEPQRAAFIRELAERWQLAPLDVPGHLTTLRTGDLRELLASGVELQNHGWSHAHHGSLSAEESVWEVREAREWLRSELGVDAPHFAVPFGDVMPGPEATTACETWLTLSDVWPAGRVTPTVFNRKNLEVATELDVFARVGARVRRSLRVLAARVFGSLRP